MATPGPPIAVLGGAVCDERVGREAFEVGGRIARRGALLLCGGGGGVMAEAARGARGEGGRTVGVMPGADAAASPPNPHIELPIFTGLGQARNVVVVLSAAAAIAIGGEWGTLSEIALALKHRIPVVTLSSWRLARPDGRPEPLLQEARDPRQAVELALAAAGAGATR